MSATLDFDTGPLNWVRGDVETALKGAAERVRAHSADPSLENALRLARDEVHMATGALHMVGLEGASKVIAALEDVLAAMDSKAIATDELNTKTVLDALETLHKWVIRMAEGRGEGELALFPTYRRLRELSGAEKIFEGELFYPNLRLQAAADAQAGVADDELPQRVKAARASFQRGLLAFLRGTKAEAGLAAMVKSLAEVESCVSSQAARAFWWACKGFVDALQNKGVEPDFHVKQLLARIDLQMRQLISGSPQVAEHLMRDALFFIAKSKSVGEDSQAVRSAFGLDKYLPKQQMDAEQLARARPVLKLIKESLTEARDHWHAFSEGRQEALLAFQAAVERLASPAGALGVPVLAELVSATTDTTNALSGLSGDALAAAQLEVATTLLFLQNAVDSEDILDPDFQPRAQSQLRRLAAARAGQAEGSASDLMDEGSLKAAEHALLAQLGQEVRSSLQRMEDALDAFFRDAEAREGLVSLDALAAQVQGALTILEQAEAAQLLQSAMEAMRPYIASGTPREEEKARIADALSSIGLFVEAHCAGRADARQILKHPQIAFGLAAPEPEPARADDFFVSEAAAPASETEPSPIETDFADAVGEAAAPSEPTLELLPLEPEAGTPASAEAVPPDLAIESDTAAEIDESLIGLVSYAEWQASTSAEQTQAEPAAVEEIISAAPAPESEPASPPPQAAPAPEIDPELLDIFLEEAAEVLSNMAASADECEANASDRENLTVIRRAFHTLKGSGRMVGLTDFGEVAWSMEQLMNGWLAEEKPATAPLLSVVRHAQGLFETWVADLRGNSAAQADARALLAEAARLGNQPEEPSAAETPAATVAETGDTDLDEPPAITEAAIEADASPEEPILVEEATAAEAAQPDEIQIGTVRLSAALYDIFKAESGSWATVLEEEIQRLSGSDTKLVSETARRGVHTLAGIAGTTGFVQLANLALAIESYFRRLEDKPVPRPALHTLLDALTRVNSMIENIHSQVVPMQAAPLIYALNQLPAQDAEQTPSSGTQITAAPAEETIEIIAPEPAPAIEESIEIIAVEPVSAAEETIEIIAAEPAPAVEEIEIHSEPVEAPDLQAPVMEAVGTEIELKATIPQASAQTAPVFEERSVQDEIDPVLLPIFLEEAETLVPEAAQALRSWIAAPSETGGPSALRRVLHTIKGSARMAGAMRLGELTHIMESRVISVLEGQATVDAAVFEKLEEEFDHLANAVDRLKFGTPEPAETTHVETEVTDTDVLVPPVAEAADAATPLEAPAPKETPAPQPAAQAPVQAAAPAPTPAPAPVQPAAPAAAEAQHRESATLRVRADWVDRMVNQAGEVAIARSRIESQMYALKRQTTELSEALRRLKDHLREVEIQAESQMQATFLSQTDTEDFDPLEFDRFTRFQEVTRFLAEGVHDIFTVQQTLSAQLGEADAALVQQARMNRELQQDLLRVRMVPLYSVSERLYRVVRQAARDLGKRAQLDIQGGDIEIDRGVLEKIVAPIEHLLRNSIAHGLEMPEARATAGKPELGEVKLAAKHEGNEMVLTVRDDGAGLDLQRIQKKAVERGLLSPGVEPSDSQLAQMIFVPGFSTAESVTQVAGRGVGMDVVKNEIAGLGGRIEIATEAGKGVTFTIYLPLTLAVTQAVILTANKHEYALPATLVEQVQELKPEALSAALQAGAIEWRGNRYPLFYLPHLLGQPEAAHEVQRFNSILLMKSGNAFAAILVDTLEGTREIVVKNIGPQVSRITGIAGATVRGDGKVVLILNPVPLALRALVTPPEITQAAAPEAPAEEEAAQAPLVMVVDDSLTVRKITSRLMAREGYRVETAKDGVDALEKMRDITPDVVLLDVEMPRMDGFELARVMRNDANLKNVPIIMITSRTADKHRNRALEIGVNVYLGKPFQEAVLLSSIADLLGDRALISV